MLLSSSSWSSRCLRSSFLCCHTPPYILSASPQGSYTEKVQSDSITARCKRAQTLTLLFPELYAVIYAQVSVKPSFGAGNVLHMSRGLSKALAVQMSLSEHVPPMKGRKHSSLRNVSFKGIPRVHSRLLAHQAAA